MVRLPVISGTECIAALSKVGYQKARHRGSHVRMACIGRKPVTVPLHSELDRGTLRAILRAAEVSPAEFLESLR